jgi:NTE family protein
MASTTIDEAAILGGIFLPGSISDHVSEHYDSLLFGGKTLQDLPDDSATDSPAPRFVINATNVQSGVLMRFSRPYMRDYRVGQIKNPKLPISKAVAASSAFPPVLSPCEIDVTKYGLKFEPPDGTEDLSAPPYNEKLVLSDGGVYDNLGLETAWKHLDTIFVSDGGGHFKAEPLPHHDWARHAYRVLDLIDSQVRALRTRDLIALFNAKVRSGAYWGIRQDVGIYTGRSALSCPLARTTELAQYPTRLQKMTDQIQERLINWGYAVCDAAIRSYFDSSLAQPIGFPFPASGV